MMINRRAFVAGSTALVAVAPALAPLNAAANVLDLGTPVLMIDGWSAEGVGDPGNQIWMRVGHGWRTAWR